jgi:predicted N-acyltransferase
MLISKHHKKLGLRTKVAKKITEIPAGEWNKVFPDVLESYDFFRTLDESHLEQFSFYYIMVYDHKIPVGATACFLMNYSLDTSINGAYRHLSNAIKKLMPNIFSLKALICGMPLGQGRMGITGQADKILQAIVRRMEHIAKKNKAPILAFKDFNQSDAHVLDVLQKRGFTKFDGLPSTELNITFKNFEDYLKTLSGASRYDLRRKFKKVDQEVVIDLKIVDSLEGGSLEEVYGLYLDVVAKHEMGFELLPKDFFKNISKNMPNHVKFFLWRIDGKLVAFLFCLIAGDLCADYYVGLDYSVAHKYHLYFIKFRDTINWCIEHKIKKYEMGNSGYEPKRRIGLDFLPLFIYVKLRNRTLRPIFNFICQFLKFENFDPDLKEARKCMAKSQASSRKPGVKVAPHSKT